MNELTPTAFVITAPQHFRDVRDIVETLHRMADVAVGQLPHIKAGDERDMLQRLISWLRSRERVFLLASNALQREPSTMPLIREWLAHAPAAPQVFEEAGSPTELLSAITGLESHLVLLFGTLMQHSDSAWVRELYRDLLDHPAPTRSDKRPFGNSH